MGTAAEHDSSHSWGTPRVLLCQGAYKAEAHVGATAEVSLTTTVTPSGRKYGLSERSGVDLLRELLTEEGGVRPPLSTLP